MKFSIFSAVRVGRPASAGFAAITGHAIGYVWREIDYAIMCDGSVTVLYGGSDLPAHAAYYDGKKVATRSQERDSFGFFFVNGDGDDELYRGGSFHTLNDRISPK